jgi:murein DD-endopeptidase MepM/ murein hydrolase activator NlpD
MHRRPRLAATALLAALSACGGVLEDRFRPASPREAYLHALEGAGLTRAALGRDWVAAGERALATPAQAQLPFREVGFFAAGEAGAVAYHVRPRRGERLVVRIEAEADSGTRLFADLFEQPADTARRARLVASSDSARVTFTVDADEPATSYVLRLQPELLRAVRYSVTVETAASLAFPVQGRDSRAVRSFWGADRDGGARSHQGIDIFAPRGTPALASADGIVRRVGETGLGGKVVWVSDLRRGQSLYYAHLDRQVVQAGQPVRIGDTLGFVGNTGNARTTAPHLHFGVYRRGEGAIDPFPYIDTRRAPPRPVGRDTALVGRVARTTAATVAVRAGPAEGAGRLREVPRQTVVAVDGAGGGWLRVRLPDGAAGYLPSSALERAERPVGRERIPASVAVRVRPEPNAPTVATAAAAVDAPVYGRFAGYVLVELDGRRGWLASDD